MKNRSTCFFAIFLLTCFHFLACFNNKQNKNESTTTSLTPRNCIQQIIAIDDSLGTLRNHACENIPLAETIRNYADGLSQLNYNNCPPAFNKAFEKHWTAWREMIPLVEKYPEMRGEMHDLFDQIKMTKDSVTFNPLLNDIWDTWAEVEAAMLID